MKRLLLTILLLLIVPASSGCLRPAARITAATSQQQSPQQAFYEAYMGALRASNAVYEETLKAVGRAKTRGLVTEAQETAWIHAGIIAQQAIEAARDALIAYLAATRDDLPAQARVLEALSAMNAAVASLTRIIDHAGKLASADNEIKGYLMVTGVQR